MNTYLHNTVILPNLLDNIIFNELGALYNPDYLKFRYNLKHTRDDVLVYLGTYFPRSFAEAYLIMHILFALDKFRLAFDSRDEISILDLGCGTGGEIFGTMCAISEILCADKTFNIVAIDGNQNAMRIFEDVLSRFKNKTDLVVNVNTGSISIEDKEDMDLLGDIVKGGFDFVLSFKAVNEFIQYKRFADNAYKHFSEILAPKLSDKGLLILLDVATRDAVSNVYYPVIMNKGFIL